MQPWLGGIDPADRYFGFDKCPLTGMGQIIDKLVIAAVDGVELLRWPVEILPAVLGVAFVEEIGQTLGRAFAASAQMLGKLLIAILSFGGRSSSRFGTGSSLTMKSPRFGPWINARSLTS